MQAIPSVSMRRLAWLAIVSGCVGPATRPASTPNPPDRTEWVAIAAPSVPRPTYRILPAELGDPGIAGRLAYRTTLRRSGPVWLELDTKPSKDKLAASDRGKQIPVIDETSTRLRVVVQDDDMRFAVWIAREDVYASVRATIQLARHDGRAHRRSGVWIDPGAKLELGARVDQRREVSVEDDDLAVANGWLPIAAVSEVFPTTPRVVRTRDASAIERQLQRGAEIRVAPEATSLLLATAADELDVYELGSADGYSEIELVRPFGMVRGYVPSSAVSGNGFSRFGTIGGGHGFGISHADRASLPLGSCVFDAAGGEVIGVSLDGKPRYARRPGSATATGSGPGWWQIYVDSPWGSMLVWAHDLKDDVQNPEWETCGTYAK